MEASGSQTQCHSQSWIHSIQSHNCNPSFAGAPPPFFAAAVPYNPSNPAQQFLANSLPLSCMAPICFSYTAPALPAGTTQIAEHSPLFPVPSWINPGHGVQYGNWKSCSLLSSEPPCSPHCDPTINIVRLLYLAEGSKILLKR